MQFARDVAAAAAGGPRRYSSDEEIDFASEVAVRDRAYERSQQSTDYLIVHHRATSTKRVA